MKYAIGVLVVVLVTASCGRESATGVSQQALAGAPADPSALLTFVQQGLTANLRLGDEPASAASCPRGAAPDPNVLVFADLNGDGVLDAYNVNHGQNCHLSGLWLGNGAGFGQNVWSGAVQPAAANPANLGVTHTVRFIGDMTGDGRVDLYFNGWNGVGALCVNQGNAAHADWTGPSFRCYAAWQALTFGDVNGDGRIDVEVLDPATVFNVYRQYCRTQPRIWKLNNGDPNPATWPSDANPFHFVGLAAPNVLLDFNKDGLPDRLQGIESPTNMGPYGTSSAGLRLSLGQADGTYVQQAATGIESLTSPVVTIQDVDEDGCLDLGTDVTGYRDNYAWYVQDRSGSVCLATFHSVPRTNLPFHPGARFWTADLDNDGLPDKIAINHLGYGNGDGRAGGVHIFRRRSDGT